MKRKVIIEEVISQEFEIDFNEGENEYKKVCEMYAQGKLVVENPWLNQAVCNICDENGKETEWIDLHVN